MNNCKIYCCDLCNRQLSEFEKYYSFEPDEVICEGCLPVILRDYEYEVDTQGEYEDMIYSEYKDERWAG